MQTAFQTHAWDEASPDPMVPARFRVDGVRRELTGVFTLDLSPVDGMAEFPFRPGQFNMLYQYGVGEVPISISGNPAHPHTLTHTVRAVGSVTNALEQLQVGALVGIRGPFGNAWPEDEADGADIVILAGGIGLAPLRPLIYRVLANRRRFGCVCIYYGARSPDEILFRDELTLWRSRFDLNVDVTVDRAAPDWMGRVGVVTKLLDRRGFSPLDTVACLCGPEIMMHYAVMTLNDQGLDNEQIYISMERNMKCAVGFCGHCQYGGDFVCRDGPVFRFDKIAARFNVREL
jgi:NAD(P)H-flavin reductase